MTSGVEAVEAVDTFGVSRVARTRGTSNAKGIHRLHRLHFQTSESSWPTSPASAALTLARKIGPVAVVPCASRPTQTSAHCCSRAKSVRWARGLDESISINSQSSPLLSLSLTVSCKPDLAPKRTEESARTRQLTKPRSFSEVA